jgi:uncharacterized membrane protein
LSLLLENSGLAEVTHLRESGAAIGIREVKVPRIGSEFRGFYTRGGVVKDVPKLEGYTSNHLEGVSDNGNVIGAATRPLGSNGGGFQGFVWNATTERLEGLGALPGHTSSYAWSISHDGNRIAGHSVGNGEIIPCIWDRKDGGWEITPLPTKMVDNPLLGTTGVKISPDGKTVVTNTTHKIYPGPIPFYESHLQSYQQNTNGEWERTELLGGAMEVNGLNNRGQIVGSIVDQNGHRRACLLDQNGLQDLGKLPGDVGAKAEAINDSGVVVGFSEDPPGPDGGNQAFIWTKEEGIKPLNIPVEAKYSSANSITGSGMIAGGLVIEEIVNEPAFFLKL